MVLLRTLLSAQKILRQKQIPTTLCVSDCDGIAKALTLTDLPEAL